MSHNKLFNLLCELIDFPFKAKKGEHTTVDKNSAK